MNKFHKIKLKNFRQLEDEVVNVLYTRHICAILGINYNSPSKEDVEKAREYVYKNYEVKQ